MVYFNVHTSTPCRYHPTSLHVKLPSVVGGVGVGIGRCSIDIMCVIWLVVFNNITMFMFMFRLVKRLKLTEIN